MKKFLKRILISLGVIFLITLILAAYVYFADPLDLRIDSDSIITEGYDHPLLNETQEKALESVGIDPAKIPTEITPEMEECFIEKLGKTFRSGNSALRALNEDMEYMNEFISHLQKALIASLGLSPTEFFEGKKIKENLLPYFRPDLVVLLQENLFNNDISMLGIDLQNVNNKWMLKTKRLLALPNKIKLWREEIWKLIENKIFHQVSSFVDLALALSILSQKSENGSQR